MDENNLIKERLKKLNDLREQGINPFPHNLSFKKDSISKIKQKHSDLKPQSTTEDKRAVAGRIMLFRRMGKAAFITIRDDFDEIQLFFRQQDVNNFDLLKYFDLGDFIGAEGTVMTTKTGELSIKVNKFEILSKAIRPLADKHKGIKDPEVKFRKRHLDLLQNEDSRETLKKRSLMLQLLREFLNKKGYMEVETPVLHPIYGGAAAKPFKTYHNAIKSNLYLRISPELYLKRLIVGGFEKIYDINKNFRNEGVDSTHNPEFTMLELYHAYTDYNDIMKLTEELYEYLALKLNGTTKTKFKGKTVDVKAPWKRITVLDAIKKYAGIDADKATVGELEAFCKKNSIEIPKEKSWGTLVIEIFEELCEDKFVNPTFVIDHPKESSPLCKAHRKDSRLIERFEPFSMGVELANAYTELNDPIIQRELLEDQARQLKAGDEEANPMDNDFVEAIENGMPPTGGLGIGLDRMAMLLLGKDSIRDVILFPALKEK